MVKSLLILACLGLAACGLKTYTFNGQSASRSIASENPTFALLNELNEIYSYHILSEYYGRLENAQKSIIAKNFLNRKYNVVKTKLLGLEKNEIHQSLAQFSDISHIHSELAKMIESKAISLNNLNSLKKEAALEAFQSLRTTEPKFQLYIANIEHTALLTKN